MSTLRATNIKHESSATNQIVLGADGSIGGTLGDTLAAKGDVAGETWTGTHDFTGATVSGIGAGLTLIEPTSIAYSGTSASSSGGVTSFTSCTSISLNGLFSATYANYRVMIEFTGQGTGPTVSWRLRASGTDSSSSNYTNIRINGSTSTVSGLGGSSQTSFSLANHNGATSDFAQALSFDVHLPYVADYTLWHGTGTRQGQDASSYADLFSGRYLAATSFDGMSILTTSGTTGYIRVYGYEGA